MRLKQILKLRRKRRIELVKQGKGLLDSIKQSKLEYPNDYEIKPEDYNVKPKREDNREGLAWCHRCKGKVSPIKIEYVKIKGIRGLRTYMQGYCPKCNAAVSTIVKNGIGDS